MHTREVRGNAKCPCKSGKRYSSCCKNRQLKWFVASDGSFYKQIPLVPEAIELLNKAAEDFQRIFERAPNKDADPVFLARYLISDEEAERISTQAMRQAGVRPELIFAYQRTGGLLLTESNKEFATTKDLQDWEDAIDEYFELQECPPQSNPVEQLFNSLEEELESCIICTGYAIDLGIFENSERTPSSSSLFTVDDYVLLCVTKSMKTLRSIRALIDEDIGSDGLALARHIYENYLHSVFAINRPDMLGSLIDAVVGLKVGSHEYAMKKSGKIDSGIIIRKSDGAKFDGRITTHKMVASSDHKDDLALFDYLYRFLSDYTHPSFTGLQLVLGEKGNLDPLSNELKGEAIFFSICFSAMILDELRRLKCISSEMKRDMQTVTRRVGAKADLLLLNMYEQNDVPRHFLPLRSRLADLGRE